MATSGIPYHKYEFGTFTRLARAQVPEYVRLQEVLARGAPPSDHYFFPQLIWANQAHTQMLAEEGIIPAEDAAAIQRMLAEMAGMTYDAFMAEVARLGLPHSLYAANEGYLIERLGEDVAGKMHTARSRGDLGNLTARMAIREEVLTAVEAVAGMREALARAGDRFADVVMPGYTQMQHAQTSTFGHWLLFYADVFERDTERLQDAYRRLDRNPLGGCAASGTTFPINRRRTTELLGFAELLENTRECKDEYPEFVAEVMHALALFFVNVSRLAQDWLLWYTDEFHMIDIPDEYCHSSSIMPQKKNPGLLQQMRQWGGKAIGDAAGCLAVFKAPSDSTIDAIEAVDRVWDHVEVLRWMSPCIAGLVDGVKPDRARMHALAADHWGTASELINAIYRRTGTNFRSGWRVVGRMVALAEETGLRPAQVTSDLLDRAAQEVLGSPLGLSTHEIRTALDPEEFVRRLCVPGAPNPQEVRRMAADRLARVARERTWVAERRDRLARARAMIRSS
ncbi:MAG: argininosuccinate lyase [Armatimonadetes bacterium]|nr:argininosuccinate lyase [Armatimonadota bacterium]